MPAHGARPLKSLTDGGVLQPDIVGSRRSRSLERVACTIIRATAGTCACFFIEARQCRAGSAKLLTRASLLRSAVQVGAAAG